MILFPNCKINIGLSVLRKRADGFHDLETIFYPLKIYDALEIVTKQENDPGISLQITGINIPENKSDNLCVKAYELLKKDFPSLPPVIMHLHKAIPMGAGLGGGSADGAFALRLLNDKYKLNLTTPELISYAVQLGSDCPFFIINKPCLASSRGETLEVISVQLDKYRIVLVNPSIHVNTGWAFTRIIPRERKSEQASLIDLVSGPVSGWKDVLINDFEEPVFSEYPEIRRLKEGLYRQGALYASMTGSGSTVFGIFEKSSNYQFDFPASYQVFTV